MSVLPGSGIISFARGVPSPELFPVRELEEASRLAFQKHSAVGLNYGPPAGFRPLQEWLGDLYGVAPGRIVITPGSYTFLALLARVLVTSGPVLVEAPTYDRMISMLRRAGAQIVPIGRSSDGIDLGALEKYLETAGRTDRPAFLYVMPSFHNPTGTTMPVPDRERLADLAIRHELLLVEDDPYGQLRFDGESPTSLHSLLTARGAGHLTVFASSFSKIIAPGLRVGYGVLPEHLAEPVTGAAAEAYVSPPMWPQAVAYEFLAAGFLPTHLARAREMLRQRRDTLVGRLDAGLSGHARWSVPDGGYFLWLELPERLGSADLLKDCERAGVTFVSGADCFFDGSGGQNAARLSFSFPSLGDIRAGADRLTAAARHRLNIPDEA
jgi:DNA-binding transcriptional MocR family regulator